MAKEINFESNYFFVRFWMVWNISSNKKKSKSIKLILIFFSSRLHGEMVNEIYSIN